MNHAPGDTTSARVGARFIAPNKRQGKAKLKGIWVQSRAHVLLLLLSILLVSRVAGAMPKADPSVAIVGATVLDGTGGPSLKDAIVVIRGGRFAAAGPRGRVQIPSNARRINAAGKWLIPGLIDMHVHLDEVLTPSTYVLYGVTSVRDVGSDRKTMRALKARAAAESLPRLYWMGRNIDQGKPSWWGAVAVKGPKEVPHLLEGMQREGVNGVKLYVLAKPDVTRAVIAEAHRRGLPVTGHLGATLPSVAAEAGIDNLEHITTLFQELKTLPPKAPEDYRKTFLGVPEVDLQSAKTRLLIATLARRHVAVTPTLTVALLPTEGERGAEVTYGIWATVPEGWRRFWHDPYWDFIGTKNWSEQDFNQARAAKTNFLKLVGRLDKAGVPILAGTDSPAPWVLPGASLLTELEMLTQAGLSPSTALQAATGHAAKVLHKSADVGTIRAGRYADCVLLDADPLADIRNLRRIHAVYRGGKPVDLNRLRQAFRQADPKAIQLHKE